LEVIDLASENSLGRPRIGVGRPVKINLPESEWKRIDQMIADGMASGYADYFRRLHMAQFQSNPIIFERWKRLK
jgi:hypothetical protein